MYAVLPQIQSEENVQLCKTPGFCLAPKLLSAAEFRFSHLTLHCLFFHSPGVEEHELEAYYVPVMSGPSPRCCRAQDYNWRGMALDNFCPAAFLIHKNGISKPPELGVWFPIALALCRLWQLPWCYHPHSQFLGFQMS